MNPKILFGIFFVLLVALPVFGQTVSPNVSVTIDLGEDSAVASPPPSDQQSSGNWLDWGNIQNQWNNFAEQFQAPISTEAPTVIPPSVQVFLPEGGINPRNNSLELDIKVPQTPGVDAQNDALDAEIKIDSGEGVPLTIASVPVSEEALEEQRIRVVVPSAETRRPLKVLVEIVKRFSREPVAKSLAVWLGTNNPDFEHAFLRLPTGFGELSAEEQQTVFENASERMEELPVSDHFFKTVFRVPLQELPNSRIASSGRILAKGSVVSFNSIAQPPFNNTTLFSQSGLGSIRLATDFSSGKPAMYGDLLFWIGNPNDPLLQQPSFKVPLGAIGIIEPSSTKPVSVFYELELIPLDIETGQAGTPLVFYQKPFDLKRALLQEESVQSTASLLELKKEEKPVQEFVGPPSPEENQADSACIEISPETAASLPPNAALELQANGQFVSKYALGLQLVARCFSLDSQKLNAAIESAWHEGKKWVNLALVSKTKKGEKSVIVETKVSLRSAKEPKNLRFVRVLETDGNEIIGNVIEPVRPIQFELEGLVPNKRLYAFSSPAEKQKTCNDLALVLQEILNFPNGEKNWLALTENESFEPSPRALPGMPAPEIAIPFERFREISEAEKNWFFGKLEPKKAAQKTLNPLQTNGKNPLIFVDGKFVQNNDETWRVFFLSLGGDKSPEAEAIQKLVNEAGPKERVFSACQFAAMPIVPNLFSGKPQFWVSPINEAIISVSFGKTKKETLLEYLAAIDSKIVKGLFQDSQAIPLSESPIKMEITKEKVCLENANHYPQLEKFLNDFLLVAQTVQGKQLLAVVPKAALLANTCYRSPVLVASTAAAGATAFSLIGFKEGKKITIANSVSKPVAED